MHPERSAIGTTRRGLAPITVAALAGVLALPRSAEAQSQIIPVEYQPARGRVHSLPWLPADASVEGAEATGLNQGGPWDKYDLLDQVVNGEKARSIYWPRLGGFPSTRDWLIYIAYRALAKNNWRDKAWTGYCMDAVAGSFFGPPIQGPINILGINFTERDRMVIATMRYGGLARDPLNPKARQDITNRVNKGEALVVNYSTIPGQEWWGVVREIHGDNVVITRYLRWWENGLQTEYKNLSQLRGAYSLHEDRPQPGFEGNFAVVNRLVGGLVIGTHQWNR